MGLRVALLASCLALLGCEEGGEDFSMTVTVDGDDVSIAWDGRAVHDLLVLRRESSNSSVIVWQVAMRALDDGSWRDIEAMAAIAPRIEGPLDYGQALDPGVVQYVIEAQALEKGADYQVEAFVYGRGETCQDQGTDGASCITASGLADFTF